VERKNPLEKYSARRLQEKPPGRNCGDGRPRSEKRALRFMDPSATLRSLLRAVQTGGQFRIINSCPFS
jgi:hypothetical protein